MKEALKLYDLIGKYIPEDTEGEHIIDFVGKIVDNIAEAKSSAYVDAICLMTKHHVFELTTIPTEKTLKLFMIGLTVNDIIGLKKFCKEINYG